MPLISKQPAQLSITYTPEIAFSASCLQHETLVWTAFLRRMERDTNHWINLGQSNQAELSDCEALHKTSNITHAECVVETRGKMED